MLHVSIQYWEKDQDPVRLVTTSYSDVRSITYGGDAFILERSDRHERFAVGCVTNLVVQTVRYSLSTILGVR
jgi:hypothetical protein